MPGITDAKGSDLLKYRLFGATGYDTNNKLVGYGVRFGTENYTHDDGKKARNLVILSTNSNALVLGKGSIKITTNDSVSVKAKDKLKTNFTIPYKNLLLSAHYDATNANVIIPLICLLMLLNSINLKLIKMKLLLEN